MAEIVRPANCRERLVEEGKPYPRSNCAACQKGMARGCPYDAYRGDGLPDTFDEIVELVGLRRDNAALISELAEMEQAKNFAEENRTFQKDRSETLTRELENAREALAWIECQAHNLARELEAKGVSEMVTSILSDISVNASLAATTTIFTAQPRPKKNAQKCGKTLLSAIQIRH